MPESPMLDVNESGKLPLSWGGNITYPSLLILYEITWRQRAQETLASLTRPHSDVPNGYLMSRE